MVKHFFGLLLAVCIASIGPFVADPRLPWWAFVSVGAVVGWLYPQPSKRARR